MVDSIRTAWVGFMLLHSQDDVEERERSQALKTERAIVQVEQTDEIGSTRILALMRGRTDRFVSQPGLLLTLGQDSPANHIISLPVCFPRWRRSTSPTQSGNMEVTERAPSLFDLGLYIQLFPTDGPHLTKTINGVVVAAYNWNTPCVLNRLQIILKRVECSMRANVLIS